MVSFTPTEDQQLLIDTIRRYAEKNIRAGAHESDEASIFDPQVIDTGWKMGLIPSALPEELGGFGEMSAVTGVLAMEELAFGELSTALHLMTPALFAYPLTLFGTADQREQYLPMFLEDEITPATAALLEPSIAFDARDLKTTARLAGDMVTLDGVKAYVPLAESATHLLVYARNSESGATDAYIVEKATTGVSIEHQEKLMGLRSLPSYRVKLDGVQVSADARLGGAVGIDYDSVLARMNVALAAAAIGVARASYEYAKEYAKNREQFGKAIAQNQAIAFMLAEMAIEVDATRLMVWEAAWMLDNGQDANREAYLARQYANQMALTVTDSGVQTLGGYGFIREYPAERWLRNARGFTTFDGLAIV